MNYGKAHNLNGISDVQVTGISTGVVSFKRITNTRSLYTRLQYESACKFLHFTFPGCHTNPQPTTDLHAFL